jgi:hypothetical protein
MTRSIFDPEGGETERSGNTLLGPAADDISHLPPDIVDGKVSEEEAAEMEELIGENGSVKNGVEPAGQDAPFPMAPGHAEAELGAQERKANPD